MRKLIFIIFLFFSSILYGKNLYFDKIEIEGLKSISKESILNRIGLQTRMTGKVFFEKLMGLHIFDDIKISVEKNILKILIKEKPYIRSVKLYGEKFDINPSNIFLDFRIRTGEFYDSSFFDVCKLKLQEYYLNKGFYNLDIDIKVKFNEKFNFVDIKINIRNKEVLKIKKIIIKGNNVYSTRKLYSFFTISKSNWMSWFTKNDVYFKGRLVSDVKRLKTLYFDNGYIDFQLNFVKIFVSKNKKDVSILLDIFEGEQHEFGKAVLEVDYPEDIKKKLNTIVLANMQPGTIFSFANLIKTKRKLTEFFYDKGVVNTVIEFNILNKGEKAVDVVFTFSVGPKIMVRRIKFIGNYITSDKVLRRFVPQLEETWLSIEKVSLGKQEILKNGLAGAVEVFFETSLEDKNSIDITFKVKEHTANKFIAGCSYFQGEGFAFHTNSDLPNFLGTGNDLSITLSKSNNHSDYNLSYLNKKFLDKNFDINYNIYYKTEYFNRDMLQYDTSSDTFGASVSYNSDIDKYRKITIGIGYDKTKVKLFEERTGLDTKKFVHKEGIKYKEYYLSLNYTYNSLDRPIFPTNGYNEYLNLRLSLPFSSINYYYFTYDLNYYKQIFNNYIFGIYYGMSYGNGFLKTDLLPFFKNFYLRGLNNVRGFRDRSLGPKDYFNETIGGNLLFSFKVSVAFPMPLLRDFDTVRTSLFLDSGQVYDTKNFSNRPPLRGRYLKYNSFFRFSVGLSITWSTPFGVPIDISIAYPLNADFMDKKKILSFAMGIQS